MSTGDTLVQSLYRGRLGAALLAVVAAWLGLESGIDCAASLADQPEALVSLAAVALSAVLSALSKWREARRSHDG